MAGADASGESSRKKLVNAAFFIVLVVFLGLLSKVSGLFADDDRGSAIALATKPLVSETKSTPRLQERVKPENEIGPPPQVELSGVVGGAEGQRLAVVSVNKSLEAVVRVGDTIFAASTVTEIDQDSLTYRHGSNLVRVVIQDRKALPQNKASSAQLPNNELQVPAKENILPGFIANTGTGGQQSSVESKNGNAEFRRAFENKVNSLRSPL